MAPNDTLEVVLQAARVRTNDAIVTINGEILTDIAAFTPSMTNNAYRRLQEYLADQGFAALNREAKFAGVPAWGSTDQGVFVSLGWAGYNNGVANFPAPVLPQDMIAPLDLFERVSGSNGNFTPIDQVYNGLPTPIRGPLNGLFEWRQETVYLPGATGATDIRLRYAGFIPDFILGIQTALAGAMTAAQLNIPLVSGANIANGTPQSGNYIQIDSEIMLVTANGGTNNPTVARGQLGTVDAAHAAGANVIALPWGIPVPIMRCLNSFAWFIASEAARARGDLDAGWFDQQAMEAAQFVWNRDYRQGKSLYKRAELGKMPDQDSAMLGPQGPRGPQRGGEK